MTDTKKRPLRKLRPAADSRMGKLLRGELSVDDLSEEELLTGILDDKLGTRSAKPTNLIPRELHTAAVRRVIEIIEGKFRSASLEATEQIIEVALGDPEKTEERVFDNGRLVSSSSRSYDPVVLKAATYVVERVAGKIPEQVQMTADITERIAVRISRAPRTVEGTSRSNESSSQ